MDTNEIHGFPLTQEELLTALLILKTSAPIGYDTLAQDVFGSADESTRIAILEAAHRNLLLKGLIRPASDSSKDIFLLETVVAEALNICVKPERTWLILHQPQGQRATPSYFHEGNNQIWCHIAESGIHQFIRVENTRDIFQVSLQTVSPLQNSVSDLTEAQLPETIFAHLVDSTQARNDAEHILTNAGLPSEIAGSFAKALLKIVSLTALASFKYDYYSTNEIAKPLKAFTVLRSEDSQWVISYKTSGYIAIRRCNFKECEQALSQFCDFVK